MSRPVTFFIYFYYCYKKKIIAKNNPITYKGVDILVSRDYFSNIPSKNVLRENKNKNKNLSEESFSNYTANSLDNMILNSNLENQNIIK